MVRHIDRPLLIVWDRLPAQRSRLVREFIELSEGHIATEFLPSYAPELNPVEYIWAYWKQHELPNVCPKDYWELDERARKSLRRLRFSANPGQPATSGLEPSGDSLLFVSNNSIYARFNRRASDRVEKGAAFVKPFVK